MRAADALKLYKRSVELAESTAIAVPGLPRASAPLLENARQTLKSLEMTSGQAHTGLIYELTGKLRLYLAMWDSMAKPAPAPEASRKQLDELRSNMDSLEIYFRRLLESRETQVRGSDRDNLKRYAEANTQLPPPVAGKPRVVFFGDSITDFWRLNEYFGDKDFVNRGISGQITGEMLGRMKADVVDLKPAAVLILAGTNDLARGVNIATIQNNYTMIADIADAHKIKIIFASILPISDYHRDKDPTYERSSARPPELINSLNVSLQRLCKARGYMYLDYASQLSDVRGFLRADFADDGLHPNSAGYRVMAPLAQAAIDRAIGKR
jgi:lysophospholipase L1-like esterase